MSRPAPLQNRVTPDGRIEADHARGLFMGNRGGRLHDGNKCLGKARWKSKAWIICRLDFKNRHRTVMGNGYTELFFLDEATALAAGHRPCFECRRTDAIRFAELWNAGKAVRAMASQMDTALHAARLSSPVTIPVRGLPNGTMILHDNQPTLICKGGMRSWSHAGYGALTILPKNDMLVLTPAQTIEVLRAGYRPVLHPSAKAE